MMILRARLFFEYNLYIGRGEALSDLHKGKATGKDGLTTEHLKYAGAFLVELLVFLFKAML